MARICTITKQQILPKQLARAEILVQLQPSVFRRCIKGVGRVRERGPHPTFLFSRDMLNFSHTLCHRRGQILPRLYLTHHHTQTHTGHSLETRPSPSSKYYNTYAHAPYVNYAWVFFRREKAWSRGYTGHTYFACSLAGRGRPYVFCVRACARIGGARKESWGRGGGAPSPALARSLPMHAKYVWPAAAQTGMV